jgi:hypothetical protein
LIVFTDEEQNNEFALSFLIPEGRELMWKQIKSLQLCNCIEIPKPVLMDLQKFNDFIKKYSSTSAVTTTLRQIILKDDFIDKILALPEEILNLTPEEIKTVSVNCSPFDLVPLTLIQKQYFVQLFSAIKDLFLINDPEITTFLFSMEKQRIKGVIECLQYDEMIDKRIFHNCFIENNVKYSMVCDFILFILF